MPRRKLPQPASSEEARLLMEISSKLDRVIAVLAAQGKEREKQVEILSAAGCDSAFVGTLVGMTASGVRGVLFKQRKKAGAANLAVTESSGEI